MTVRDSNGNELRDGDAVVVIKDLRVKGSSDTLKRGTALKNFRLIQDDEEAVECGSGRNTLQGARRPVARSGTWRRGRRRAQVDVERALARRDEVPWEPHERQSHDACHVGDGVEPREVDTEAVAAREQRVVGERKRIGRERELDRRRVGLARAVAIEHQCVDAHGLVGPAHGAEGDLQSVAAVRRSDLERRADRGRRAVEGEGSARWCRGGARERTRLQRRRRFADGGIQRDLEEARMWARCAVAGREHRRQLARDDAACRATQAAAGVLGLAGERVDVAQQGAELEVLVEVERQEFGEQRESLGAGEVGLRAARPAVGFVLQQRTDELLEHRRAQRRFRLLALVAERLHVVLRGDGDLALLEGVGEMHADDGGAEGRERDRKRIDDVRGEPDVAAPAAVRVRR
ncbi:MAG: hypothetical protein FIB04_12090 [Gammaproteobacteria bacterium]|nr:hypothetical protein [Gammaproteobacteria bacterium]